MRWGARAGELQVLPRPLHVLVFILVLSTLPWSQPASAGLDASQQVAQRDAAMTLCGAQSKGVLSGLGVGVG